MLELERLCDAALHELAVEFDKKAHDSLESVIKVHIFRHTAKPCDRYKGARERIQASEVDQIADIGHSTKRSFSGRRS